MNSRNLMNTLNRSGMGPKNMLEDLIEKFIREGLLYISISGNSYLALITYRFIFGNGALTMNIIFQVFQTYCLVLFCLICDTFNWLF